MRVMVIGSFALLTACQGPLSTLAPGGPQARSVYIFTGAMTLVALLAFGLVIALFALAVRRGRRSAQNAAAARTGPAAVRAEHRWTIWLGVVFPLIVLTSLLAATLWIGEGQFVRDERLPTWRATASQWGWQFAPVNPDGSLGASSERLIIPSGEPVIVEIGSTDVIHSFWVPQLAGKMDAIPGKLNRHLIEADQPGTFRGQCAEYCGIGHDLMRFDVVAVGPQGPASGSAR